MLFWFLTLIFGLFAALFTTGTGEDSDADPAKKPDPNPAQDDDDDPKKKPDPAKDKGDLPDYVKELRKEAADNRAAMKDFQTLIQQMTGTLQEIVTGKKPDADDPKKKPDLKTKEGDQVFTQITETLNAVNKRLEDAEKAVKDSELKTLKESIGRKYGLDATLTLRLQGGTREELEADAKLLAKSTNGKTPPLGNSGADDSDTDVKSWHPLTKSRSSGLGRGGVRNPE